MQELRRKPLKAERIAQMISRLVGLLQLKQIATHDAADAIDLRSLRLSSRYRRNFYPCCRGWAAIQGNVSVCIRSQTRFKQRLLEPIDRSFSVAPALKTITNLILDSNSCILG